MARPVRLLVPHFGAFPALGHHAVASLERSALLEPIVIADDPRAPDCAWLHRGLRTLSIDLPELGIRGHRLAHGYKLCDYKPFLSRIFATHIGKRAWWGFAGLDALYGDLDTYVLQAMEAHAKAKKPVVAGARGHFMLFSPDAQALLIEGALALFGRRFLRYLLRSSRVFAFDEANFLHRVLEKLHADSRLIWQREVTARAVEVDYWKARPFCTVGARGIRLLHGAQGKIFVCYEGGEAREAAYVRVQNRRFDAARSLPPDAQCAWRLEFLEDGAFARVNSAHASRHVPASTLAFPLAALGSRVASKLGREALLPSLQARASRFLSVH